jgi:putative ABC transport system ATP-binding protein
VGFRIPNGSAPLPADTSSSNRNVTRLAVDVKEVTKTYRTGVIEVPALRGVSLRIAPGEFVATAGPSGSGKTTLLNMIGGLDRADSGEVWVAGQDLQSLSLSDLARLRLNRIGFVFQTYNLLPVLTALENAEFTLLLQGVPASTRRERVEKLFSEIGLNGLEDRRPAELSGGQQQRVAVVRAMVTAPSLILADEPTANLDSATASSLLDVMEHLNRITGTTFIFSTHDAQVMERAHRMIRLRDGRIVSDETRPESELMWRQKKTPLENRNGYLRPGVPSITAAIGASTPATDAVATTGCPGTI